MSDENNCVRCKLPMDFNYHSSFVTCVEALKRENEQQRAQIKRQDERLLELEKELREKDWELSTQ